MPAVSGRQYRKAQASLHGKPRGKAMPKAVAREMIEKTPPVKRKRWARKPKRKKHG